MLVWPRGYVYQGKSVQAWFKDCANDSWVEDYASTGEMGQSGEVFRSMGTNAVPFLASRITRDLTPSWFEPWLPERWLPVAIRRTTKEHEAYTAGLLIWKCINPPESMLRELLKPAMSSTNYAQSVAVSMALERYPPTQ